jgi:RNA polymerase sigma-70 factor (ECF subfamily)
VRRGRRYRRAARTSEGRRSAGDAYLDLAKRLPEYAANPALPFFLWLRLLTGQRLLMLHRRHLGAKMRDAGQEVSLRHADLPSASSLSLAERLLGTLTSPTQAAIRAEMERRLQEVLDTMDPTDREILVLRHFEELSNNETAAVLGLQKTAASNRYVRALKRLREILSEIPGFLDG